MLQNLTESPNETVEIINVFCEKYGIAPSTFGQLAVNNGKFVSHIAGGSRFLEVTSEVLEKNSGLWFVNETFSVTRKSKD